MAAETVAQRMTEKLKIIAYNSDYTSSLGQKGQR